MKLLANENFPKRAVDSLREAGHDVLWARSDLHGWEDDKILERAQADGRIVLTFDKDFGELAFHFGLPATSGVILFRFALQSPEFTAQRTVEALDSRSDWAGHFAVVEEDRLRMRILPTAGSS